MRIGTSSTHTERYSHELCGPDPDGQVVHLILRHTRFPEDVEGVEVQLRVKVTPAHNKVEPIAPVDCDKVIL